MSKISSGAIMLAFVAVLFGLLGAYVVREVLRRPRTAQRQKIEMVTVPMASTDLKPGRKIALGDVGLARMTRAEMKERGISRAFMTDTNQIIGRTLRKEMKRGDRFDTTLFYPDGIRPGLAGRLKPGFRAVTIPVWSDDALLGFAGPGSWVDVIFRSSPIGQSGGYGPRYHADRNDADHPAWQDYTRHYGSWHGAIGRNRNRRNPFAQQIRMEQTVTLLENVQVLAVDRETFEGITVESQESERMTVTLAVKPEQATSLRIVDGRGELSLALRAPDDEATVQDGAPRTLEDIIDIPDDPMVEQNHDMEVYRGFRMSRVGFDGTGIGSRRGGGGSGHRGSLWTDLGAPPADGPPANVAYAAEIEARAAAQGR